MRFTSLTLAILFMATEADASGPVYYSTPFVDRVSLADVMAGDFPDRISRYDRFFPLITYLHLTGQYTAEHDALFSLNPLKIERPYKLELAFWESIREENYDRPQEFSTWKLVSRLVDEGWLIIKRRVNFIENCQPHAFKTAQETFLDRRAKYGSGSAELSRWIEAQLKVFTLCYRELGIDIGSVVPEEPDSAWSSLQQHDRRYQIAAANFYAGRYLEAASLFEEISRNNDSPWQGISRYLIGRSLVREATVNENEPDRHFQLALNIYRKLADEPEYRSEFPFIVRELRGMRAKFDQQAVRREIEQAIINEPSSLSKGDLLDYYYISKRYAEGRETEYEDWYWHLMSRTITPEDAFEQWNARRSPQWLYVALVKASSTLREDLLNELLDAAEAWPEHEPGYLNTLMQRIRILFLLGRIDAAQEVAESASESQSDRSRLNRIRLATARSTTNWPDFLRWASLKPTSLPWADDSASEFPRNTSRITTNTTLFDAATTTLLNHYFTASMIERVIEVPGLSVYQRGRMAIAGWTKAMLSDDLETALVLSTYIRRYVPWLDGELLQFEEGSDKHFEAARIIFDYPAFSPWMAPGAGRISVGPVTGDFTYRPVPDHVLYGGLGKGWWCEERWRSQQNEERLASPRFAQYTESEMDEIRRIWKFRKTAATTSFGPDVIRYSRENTYDPRVPRTLHRLVFATRYACDSYSAPGRISQAAYALLHKHFPDSEWAAKTPFWFGRLE